MRKTFSWTPPGEIEGDPVEVEELVLRQLDELAATVSEVVADSFIQLRAAQILDAGGAEAWEATKRGRLAELLVRASTKVVLVVDHLSRPDSTRANSPGVG